jgi:hypothetical protein
MFEVLTTVTIWVLVWLFSTLKTESAHSSETLDRICQKTIIELFRSQLLVTCVWFASHYILPLFCPLAMSYTPSFRAPARHHYLCFSLIFSLLISHSLTIPSVVGTPYRRQGQLVLLQPFFRTQPPTFYQSHLRYSCNKLQRGAI